MDRFIVVLVFTNGKTRAVGNFCSEDHAARWMDANRETLKNMKLSIIAIVEIVTITEAASEMYRWN